MHAAPLPCSIRRLSAKDLSETSAAWQITDAAAAGLDLEGAGTVSEGTDAVVHSEVESQVFHTPVLIVNALPQCVLLNACSVLFATCKLIDDCFYYL